jgi:hypothetical protein
VVWGFLAGSLAKTAVRGVAREIASGPRREGGIAGPATSPRAVSFVIPAWFGVWGGGLLAAGALAIVAQVVRAVQGRTSPGEAATASLLGAVICALPGFALAAYAAVVARKKQRLRRVQTLASGAGGVALTDLAADLGVSPDTARTLALEALRDEHVIGRIDEMNRLVSI